MKIFDWSNSQNFMNQLDKFWTVSVVVKSEKNLKLEESLRE